MYRFAGGVGPGRGDRCRLGRRYRPVRHFRLCRRCRHCIRHRRRHRGRHRVPLRPLVRRDRRDRQHPPGLPRGSTVSMRCLRHYPRVQLRNCSRRRSRLYPPFHPPRHRRLPTAGANGGAVWRNDIRAATTSPPAATATTMRPILPGLSAAAWPPKAFYDLTRGSIGATLPRKAVLPILAISTTGRRHTR